jgi:3-phosphoglycerate kinase
MCSPPGVFEFENFAAGTKAVMDAIVQVTAAGATTIIGKLLDAVLGFSWLNGFCDYLLF